jgi:iron complex outermembrane recepter protein
MKKLRLTPLSILLIVNVLSAQNIVGTINDANNKPLEFATAMLMRAKDTALVKGAISDEAGRFELNSMSAGTYFLRVSSMGFKTFNGQEFEFDGKNDADLGKIALKSIDSELKEVTITAAKPLIEVKADKTIFNVDASPTNTGLNGLELLRKSPSVSLDQNDNISLKGRQNVVVQLNGKILMMSGQDLAQFLKSLNANDIEAIEIIANPSAKFDAEGNAGVINIRLKRDKKLGTNGSVNIGLYQGITPKGDASVSFNHRDKKFNVFGSASTYRGRSENSMRMDNRVGNGRFNSLSNSYYYGRPHNARLGFDYSPSRFHTFGALVSGGFFNPNSYTYGQTEIGNYAKNQIDSMLVAQTSGSSLNWNGQFNANYRFADTAGKTLNIDVDYGVFRDSNTNLNENFYRTPDLARTLSTTAIRMNTPRDINLRSVKFDYEQPFRIIPNQKGNLGFGGKYSDVLTDNTFNFFDIVNKSDVFNTDRSNNFKYHERIAAAYLNLNTPLSKKLSLQAGLRLEHTDSKGDLTAFKPVNSKTVDTAYTNLFPSAALTFEFSKKLSTTLTYRRSLDRPRYQVLNPFEFRLDELSFRKGNPFVRPQYTQSVEWGFLMWQRINFSVNYAQTTGAFTEISDQEIDPTTGKQRFFIQTRNVATRDNIGASVSFPMSFAKWWNGNANVFYNYSILKANYGGERSLNLNAHGGGIWMQNVITLSKTVNFELSGWGNLGGLWGAYYSRPQGVMDIGMTQKVLKGDGTLRLSFTDVWRTARWSAYTELGKLYIDAWGRWEGQQLKANFSYRFGNKNVQSSRRRSLGSEEERKRVD